MRGKKIVIKDVEKTFQTRSGPVLALNRVNLSIEPSSFVSVVGPSGCGKSTLMNLIAGLDQPTVGTVEVNGKVTHEPQDENAIVFQKDLLLEWRTILGNILLPSEIQNSTWFDRKDKQPNRKIAEELLKMVGLEGFGDKYPSELSGGMKQRVAICRGLIQNPSLLMMDEPFGALDALTREQMMLDLLKIYDKYKFTVLFITHSIEEAVFLSDRVLVMSSRPGKVVRDISIDLPRPRSMDTRSNTRFMEYVHEIRGEFKSQGILKEM
ncbi:MULTISPECIES: ABC transporter ATP-binding protein [unclassified Paenibacillus]|uniref:ABC transporter ATP-binding protein n=1 Tax=unclassified Paenibacillus TaxID=185978 RepID=UPI001AE6BB62|nr:MULTISPECIES: ABC transporter ATP-binding protein [unclassified Paenibacillus]MBP1154492.1 NitT/TauT family transport system ATP-binding protein [Paenibacillus sp. PvP091]MBP1170124.1 NitT/TauT family transport system ATP-binding protein [Paenibacillus sp. PvR098]MBP2441152.1 NitT/TauT family transport system ATP-binding protein [Paenibacillus sp. PvP052]